MHAEFLSVVQPRCHPRQNEISRLHVEEKLILVSVKVSRVCGLRKLSLVSVMWGILTLWGKNIHKFEIL